jgi:hypothetical protein
VDDKKFLREISQPLMSDGAADDGHDAGPLDDLRREQGHVDAAEHPDWFKMIQI